MEQTYPLLEYIVIDGGSTDGTVAVIEAHPANIQYSVSEKDNGIYHAMNKGAAKAKGEYLLFLNAGDWLVSAETIAGVVDFISKAGGNEIYTGNLIAVFPNGTQSKNEPPVSITQRFLFDSTLSHPASFIEKQLFIKAGGYNEQLKICSDWEFFLKVFLHYNTGFARMPIDIVFFDTDGISSKKENYPLVLEERTKTLEKLFPVFYKDYLYFKQMEITLHTLQQNKLFRIFNKLTGVLKK